MNSLIDDDNYIIHNIKNTDTLSGLSLLYNTDINIIKKVNNLHSGDIWSFSFLKIPKNNQCMHAKQLNENSDYYKNAKRYDHIKLLKQLTHVEDDIIKIIYDTTKEQFKESLIILEKIAELHKKLNQDISIIVAYYLVYYDKTSSSEDVFSIIEEEVLEHRKQKNFKNNVTKQFLANNNLQNGLDINCNSRESKASESGNFQNKDDSDDNKDDTNHSSSYNTWYDTALVHRLGSSLKLKSSSSFSYVKNIFNRNIPMLNFQNEKKEAMSDTDFKSLGTWVGIPFYKKDPILLKKKRKKKKRDSPMCDNDDSFLEEHGSLVRRHSTDNLRKRL